MSEALPARANLAWLRKTAKQELRAWRAEGRDAKLSDVQFALARQYGFSSWRALKAHVELQDGASADVPTDDEQVAGFLAAVGDGRRDDVRAALSADPQLVNAVGPHPYWGGRPQALHVSIETRRRTMFDLLLDAGADVDGSNEHYDHCSPLMLTVHWDQPEMRQVLLARGARVGLFEALLFGDDAAVEKLLGTAQSRLPEPNGGSLLALARTPFAIDRLLALGVSTEKKDRWGAAPMEVMSRLGRSGKPLVQHLLTRGITAEPQDYARLGDKDTLAALVEAKPTIARSDAVMMAAVDFGHRDLVRWLLERGANVNARATIGSRGSALHSAAWNGDLEMVKLLVAAGADVTARDAEHDNTPAGWAEVSVTVSNNPNCQDVADYLSNLKDRPQP
jgi:ankyrin repeat protein